MPLLNEINKPSFAAFLRAEMSEERMVVLDFSYLAAAIDGWWKTAHQAEKFFVLKSRLDHFLGEQLTNEDSKIFDSVGLAKNKIAAVCVKNIFNTDSPKLALLVHEVLSDLFQITDIKYDYEEHKALYLKPSAVDYKDWGSGYGEITPHCDDLYENLNIDYLSLTTCRDQTKTATQCFFPKDILRDFSDDELCRLIDLKAHFKSGKNVDILIEKTRNILEYSEKYGFRFFLDFRIDNITGERMVACNAEDQFLIDKMRAALDDCPYQTSIPATGTFFIVANNKVLHARQQMHIDKALAAHCSEHSTLVDTPRLLYRSKGPRRDYLEILS